MIYIIMKSSRNDEIPFPYVGPACDKAGVSPGKFYKNRDEAVSDALKLTAVNPVGFVVVEYMK